MHNEARDVSRSIEFCTLNYRYFNTIVNQEAFNLYVSWIDLKLSNDIICWGLPNARNIIKMNKIQPRPFVGSKSNDFHLELLSKFESSINSARIVYYIYSKLIPYHLHHSFPTRFANDGILNLPR